MLTGLIWGFGGLWVLNDGTLSLIPDADGNDVPDGPPIEMLNGWTKTAGHNFVNGLMWGPDGWLYGRHGITDSSLPGTPDTLRNQRQPMNCGVWRFHPVHHKFEVVCHGTTNPWGMDYNKHGQMFITNNVIGHLWHVIPGAHYQRMFGQDFNPHLFELMGACSDHYHWDHSGNWQQSRDGAASDLGGGHSHCGGMIYEGSNFPDRYRGAMFMANIHGRCINIDRLERNGSTWTARHRPNFLRVRTPWFRGLELRTGPRGYIYLSDWSDNGECHDRDGVHRTSGRIYRIAYTHGPSSSPIADWSNQSVSELLKLMEESDNQWLVRRVRRLIMQRLTSMEEPTRDNDELEALHDALMGQIAANPHQAMEIARILAFHNRLNASACRAMLQSTDEWLRVLVINHAAENFDVLAALGDDAVASLRRESSRTVLLAWASLLQRIDADLGSPIIDSMIGQLNLNPRVSSMVQSDATLTLMTWYAVERQLQDILPNDSLTLSRIPKIRNFTLRRLATEWNRYLPLLETGLEQVETLLPQLDDSDRQSILLAILNGLRGQRHLRASSAWNALRMAMLQEALPKTRSLIHQIDAGLGGESAVDELRAIAADRYGDHATRSRCIHAIAELRDPEALPVLLNLLTDRAVYVDVAAALARFDDPRVPKELLRRWTHLRHGSRDAAIDTLCSRATWAGPLMTAIEEGRVDAGDLSAAQVRQLLAFDSVSIRKTLETHWGTLRETPSERTAQMQRLRNEMSAEVLAAADLEAGQKLFTKNCATCHRLYGSGGVIGPDITGANRGNLDYLLTNIVDPSAEVPAQFTVSILELNSGQVVNGVIVAETDQTISLQTDKAQRTIAVSDVVNRVRTSRSLMPDGLLDSLSDNEIRDLLAYMMSKKPGTSR